MGLEAGSILSSKGDAVVGDPESEHTSFTSMAGSPRNIYQPEWGVTNGCRLDTPEICQDLVDHLAPPGCFSKLRHLPIDAFLSQYNINLARQVAMGSQLRLRYEQEALLEAEADMKKATEANNVELSKELESLRTKFSDLQVNNNRLSQQVTTLQAQVTGEERIKASFEEFKKYKDDRFTYGCFKVCGIPRVETGFCQCGVRWDRQRFLRWPKIWSGAMRILKDLKYPLIDELEKLKDAPMDIVMTSLYLESDTGEDAPKWIRDLRPSSSQLKIPVYPEVHDPKYPWAVKEEMLLEDAIAANKSRAKKKRKCRIVFRTHGVSSAHHARSDGVPVSAPTVIPQGLQILLRDAATQTEPPEDRSSPRLVRSKSLPAMYNLDWP
ncbi:hypothetical protein Tco_0397731 [Tanacetum coccineum]